MKFPGIKSKLRYIGGVNHENCWLTEGEIYEVTNHINKSSTEEKEYIVVKEINNELGSWWPIFEEHLQCYEIIEAEFTNDEYKEILKEKEKKIEKLKTELKELKIKAESDKKVLDDCLLISYDYDGFTQANSLMGLIDEMNEHIKIVLLGKSTEFLKEDNGDNGLTPGDFLNKNKKH